MKTSRDRIVDEMRRSEPQRCAVKVWSEWVMDDVWYPFAYWPMNTAKGKPWPVKLLALVVGFPWFAGAMPFIVPFMLLWLLGAAYDSIED